MNCILIPKKFKLLERQIILPKKNTVTVFSRIAKIAVPLTDLTRKFSLKRLQLTEAQELAFQTLKFSITRFPIFQLPDLSKVFRVKTHIGERTQGCASTGRK